MNPNHPYTVGLMNSIPSIAKNVEWLTQIDGAMPHSRQAKVRREASTLPTKCVTNWNIPLIEQITSTKSQINLKS